MCVPSASFICLRALLWEFVPEICVTELYIELDKKKANLKYTLMSLIENISYNKMQHFSKSEAGRKLYTEAPNMPTGSGFLLN